MYKGGLLSAFMLIAFTRMESEIDAGDVPTAKLPLITSFVVAFLIFAGLN